MARKTSKVVEMVPVAKIEPVKNPVSGERSSKSR